MYIHPILVGIIGTLLVEIAIVAISIWYNERK